MGLGGNVRVPMLKCNMFRMSPRRYRHYMLSTVDTNCQLVSATRTCCGRRNINGTVTGYNISHSRLFLAAGI